MRVGEFRIFGQRRPVKIGGFVGTRDCFQQYRKVEKQHLVAAALREAFAIGRFCLGELLPCVQHAAEIGIRRDVGGVRDDNACDGRRPADRQGMLDAPPTDTCACVCIRCRTWLATDPSPNIESAPWGGSSTTICPQWRSAANCTIVSAG
jgi:hypothetical protein